MQTATYNIVIRHATDEDMPLVLHLAQQYKLDTRDLKTDNLLVAKEDGTLLGFGRLKYHKEFTEMGTFAVIPNYRHKGIGHKLMNHLLNIVSGEVYLFTTIPEYGYRFGFRELKAIPDFIKKEIDVCKEAHYPEKVYVLWRKPTESDNNHISK